MRRPLVLHIAQLGNGARSFSVRSADESCRPRTAVLAAVAAAFAAVLAAIDAMGQLVFFLLLVAGWILARMMCVREETLIAIEGIGIQLYTRLASGHEHSQFIETHAVSDIFIAEAVRVDRCYFHIACLLHGGDGQEPRLVIPFRHLLPPLRDLEIVLAGVRAVLMAQR